MEDWSHKTIILKLFAQIVTSRAVVHRTEVWRAEQGDALTLSAQVICFTLYFHSLNGWSFDCFVWFVAYKLTMFVLSMIQGPWCMEYVSVRFPKRRRWRTWKWQVIHWPTGGDLRGRVTVFLIVIFFKLSSSSPSCKIITLIHWRCAFELDFRTNRNVCFVFIRFKDSNRGRKRKPLPQTGWIQRLRWLGPADYLTQHHLHLHVTEVL